MNTDPTPNPAVAGPVELPVRPYATSVTWRNDHGGSWQQWHDDDDPIPAEWDDRPPDEVVHVYAAAQVAEMLAAERERCAKLIEPKNPPSDWTPYAHDCAELAARIRSGA